MRTPALLASCVLVTACAAPAPAGLVLEGVIGTDDACLVDGTMPLREAGTIDTTPLPERVRPRGIAYTAALRLRNEELDLPTRYARQAIPYVVTIHAMVIEIRHDGMLVDLAASGLPNPFQVPADGRVGFARAEHDPAVGPALASLLPEQYVVALDAQLGETEIDLWMRAVGTTPAGAPRTSTTAVFPIRLCLGCLVSCATDGSARSSCFVGQDEPSTVPCE